MPSAASSWAAAGWTVHAGIQHSSCLVAAGSQQLDAALMAAAWGSAQQNGASNAKN